jgi:hypothetical protein
VPIYKSSLPQISVRLYKTISRTAVDGQTAVSERYAGKDEFIDLTPFLNDRSSVRTSKSVREPSGGFVITFADKAEKHSVWGGELESIYGLVEPMDMVEIRMWGGTGTPPTLLPIVMRGFVSQVERPDGVSDDGKPTRQVVVTGQDYGKIWQTFQVIYLAAYAEGQGLLSNYGLWELFGVQAANTMKAGEFVRTMVEKIINPHMDGFIPKNSDMPRKLQTGDSISVAHGLVNNSYQQMEGSIYDILKVHGDVGVWNELYTEDREDGVHVVYRAIPALHITKPSGAKSRKIQDDAPDPVYCTIYDDDMQSLAVSRSDANVANFYWVNNSRFDLIDDMQRKMASIPKDDSKVSLKDYPNAAVKYYGVRPMYAHTQQAGDEVKTMTSGQPEDVQSERSTQQEAWIDKRRRLMMEMNRDNVVFESGSATVKGGQVRDGSTDLIRAGDYALFAKGRMMFEAYVVQVNHDFRPFQGYTMSLALERCTGFVERAQMGGGSESPWLAEQARRSAGLSA